MYHISDVFSDVFEAVNGGVAVALYAAVPEFDIYWAFSETWGNADLDRAIEVASLDEINRLITDITCMSVEVDKYG